MSWYNKEQPTPFDDLPADGLFFKDGDFLARTQHYIATKGHKLSMMSFPSGLEFIFSESGMREKYVITLFDQMDLPVFCVRDRAYIQAQIISDLCSFQVEKIGDNQLKLWGHKPEERFLLTFNNEKQRLTNVERFVE